MIPVSSKSTTMTVAKGEDQNSSVIMNLLNHGMYFFGGYVVLSSLLA